MVNEQATADDCSADFESLRDRALAAAGGEYRRDLAEKLARIMLDHMYQFVALLDARGTLLEVNLASPAGGAVPDAEPGWSGPRTSGPAGLAF